MTRLYNAVADVLYDGAIQFVPSHKMSLYKFWCSQELNIPKESTLASDRFWKAAGKLCRGRIYQNSSVDIKAYRNKIKGNW